MLGADLIVGTIVGLGRSRLRFRLTTMPGYIDTPKPDCAVVVCPPLPGRDPMVGDNVLAIFPVGGYRYGSGYGIPVDIHLYPVPVFNPA
jgi:hypothetical protein